MDKFDIEARLERIRVSCVEAAYGERDAIARKKNSEHMLNSGNYFVAVVDAIISREKSCLEEMGTFVVTVSTAAVAATIVQKHGQILSDDLRELLNRTFKGDGGSNPLSDRGADDLRQKFDAESSRAQATIVENIRHGIDSRMKSERGFWGFLKQHAALFSLAVSAFSLVVSVLAFLRK